MSFTPQQYAEIDQAINNLKINPNQVDERLEPFQTDPTFLIHHQFLLSNSNHEYTLVYSSKFFDVLLRQEHPICTIQLMKNLFDWIPELLQGRSDFIGGLPAQYQQIILPNLVRGVAFIISKLWNDETHLGNLFQSLSGHFPDSDPPHRILRYTFFAFLIREILDTFQLLRNKIVGDKQDTALFDLFNEIVQSNFPDPSQISINALQLMLVILMFYQKTNQSNTKSKTTEKIEYTCDLPPQFRDLFVDQNFINTLFSIIPIKQNPNFARIILQIVYQMVSVKSSYFAAKDNTAMFVSVVFHNLALIINEGISNLVLQDLGLVLNKISSTFFRETNILGMIQEETQNLIQQVGNIMPALLSTPETFLKENFALVNIMQFWINITTKYAMFKDTISPIFRQYIECLMNASEADPNAIVEILELDKAAISDAITIIPIMLKTDFDGLTEPLDRVSRQVFEKYKESLVSGDGGLFRNLDIQLSCFILLMASGLRSVATKQTIRKRDTLMAFEVAFLNFIFEVSEFTGENIQHIFEIHKQYYEQNGCISMFGLFVEKAIYQFSINFQKSNQGYCRPEPSREEIDQVAASYQRVIKRLVDALLNLHLIVDQPSLIFDNLKALQACYCGKQSNLLKPPIENETPIAFAIPITVEFLGLIANGKFAFVSNPLIYNRYSKEIVLLMQIARSIVTGQKEAITTFLQGIDAKFATLAQAGQNVAAVLIFIYELTGIFSEQPEGDTSFAQFFQWIFPEKLAILANISQQISTDPKVSAAYFKFWYKLMKILFMPQDKIRDIFPKHSANEIVLITMISNLLLAYFQVTGGIQVSEDDIYQMKLKPFKNAMLLMAYALGTDYIMYGAFDFYDDKTLINLLTAFIAYFSTIPFELIHQYPKVDQAFNFLIKTLCQNHLMNILQISPEFFSTIFIVILNGLEQEDLSPSSNSDPKDANGNPIKSARYLGEFLVNNKNNKLVADAIEQNAAAREQIITRGFSLIFKKPVSIDLIGMIRPYLSFMPGYVEQLGRAMMPQVSEENMAEYTQVIQELIKVVSEMFIFENFRKSMSDLKTFAEKQKLKVPIG